jgi:hypothetical protein
MDISRQMTDPSIKLDSLHGMAATQRDCHSQLSVALNSPVERTDVCFQKVPPDF